MSKVKENELKQSAGDTYDGEDQNQSMKRKDFSYLDLLDDNAPKSFCEYDAEASIINKEICAPGVYNIAVVAKYGAGKSSVINTYLHNYRRTKKEIQNNATVGEPEKNKYTRITLSTFNNTNYDETAIERSILQQLLYSRKQSKLPNSEIKRTNKTSVWKSLFCTFLITAFLLSTLLFSLEISRVRIWGNESEWLKYVFLGISSAFLASLIFWLVHSSKLKRVKYKEFEVEVHSNNGENTACAGSLINKFIDEVLYFFECVDIDLVIFEDLDRLPTTEIFSKLRELNTLIIGSKKKSNKVTFLYAVKDDLFYTEEERAKFFEFILPVVPVVNQVTTSDKLREILATCAQKNPRLSLKESFIKGISAYIPDMRILKNAVNDYIIMFNKIFEDTDAKVDALSSENLFALSLYKSLFPYDYTLLEKNAGLIPMVICMDKLRDKALSEITTKLKEANEKIELINKETIKSIQELKYIFIGCVTNFSLKDRNYYEPHPIDILEKDVSFTGLNHRIVAHPRNHDYYIDLPRGNAEVLLPNGEHFADRERVIREKCENNGKEIKSTIFYLEKDRREILEASLKKLVDLLGIENVFPEDLLDVYLEKYDCELQANYGKGCGESGVQTYTDLFQKQVEKQINYLRFLVVNHYIDERYIEYTSNYKAQLIALSDAQFVSDVQLLKQNFDYVPSDMQKVIERLNDEDFIHYSVLNRKLLDHIDLIEILDKKEGTHKHHNLLNLFEKNDAKVFDSIEKYISLADDNAVENLLRTIIPICPTLAAQLLQGGKLTTDKSDLLVYCVIKYAADYKEQNEGEVIRDYVNSHMNYLALLSHAEESKVISFLDSLRPSIHQLLCGQTQNAMQHYVIEHSLYKISVHNIEIALEIADKEDLKAEFYARPYGFVMESGKECIIQYVTANLNQFVTDVIFNEQVSLESETPACIDTLLKNEDIDIELRKAIIEKTKAIMEHIEEYDPELYGTFLVEKKVKPLWENIICAYNHIGYKQEIEDFIATMTMSGDFSWVQDKENKIAFALYRDILTYYNCFEHDINKVVQSIEISYPLQYFKVSGMLTNHPAVTDNGIKMVDKNISAAIMFGQIKFSVSDLQQLKLIPASLKSYLKKYNNEILNQFSQFFGPGNHELVHLIGDILGDAEISMAIKVTLIQKYANIVDIRGHEKNYARFFIDAKMAVPTKILWQFTGASMVSQEDRRDLLYLTVSQGEQIKKVSEEYKAYFATLGPEWERVYTDGKHRIKQEPSTERLLCALKERGLIASYRKDSKGAIFNGAAFHVKSVS